MREQKCPRQRRGNKWGKPTMEPACFITDYPRRSEKALEGMVRRSEKNPSTQGLETFDLQLLYPLAL